MNSVIAIVNPQVPKPPLASRRVTWLHDGDSLRLWDGIDLVAHVDAEVALEYRVATVSVSLTVHQPVTFNSAGGGRVVARAVSIVNGRPHGVLIETESPGDSHGHS